MNLEAPPWIADFRFSAALEFFFLDVFLDFGGWFFLLLGVFRVFGSGFFLSGVFLVCLFSLSLVWDGFCVFCPAYPPAQCRGWSVGNRATHLWHRTRFQSYRLGFRWFLTCPALFFFSFLIFTFHFSMHLPRLLPPVAGDMAMAFIDDFFLPLQARSSFHFFCLRTLQASLSCRSQVWEWVLRSRIFDSCASYGIGVCMNFP